jgi:TonB-linked SusC/RagA family outer membrane protein
MIKFNKISMLCLGLLLACGLTSAAYGQRTLPGTVTDENEERVIGAVGAVKGTDNAVITAVDGTFHLTVPSTEVTLTVTHLGYISSEVTVPAGTTTVRITLQSQTEMIDEVVVMGMGKVRRINVTGAVGAVSGNELLSAPVPNVTNALVGNVPGITGLNASGEPGHNSTDIKIRGISTYGMSTPLIVIDGIEQPSERAFDQINVMDPNEIASISILKDASSTAIYGIRGANGVIIVTTKRGVAGAPKISFSGNFGLVQASQYQEGVTSYEWASMRNEAIYGQIKSFSGNESQLARIYSDYDLWKFKNNRDFTPVEVDAMAGLSPEQKEQLKNSPALYYQSHDLYKEQFSKIAPQWNMNLNVTGGTDKVKYFASLGYFKQGGLTNSAQYYNADTRSQFQRYNYRANFDIDVTRNLRISITSAGEIGNAQVPGASNDPWDLNERYKTMMQNIYDGNPFTSIGIIDGKLAIDFAGAPGSVQNPLSVKTQSLIGDATALSWLIRSGMSTVYNTLLDNTVKVEHTMDYLLRGLKLRGTVGFQDNYNRRIQFWPSVPMYGVQRNIDNPNVIEFFGGATGGNSFSSYGYGNWNKLYLDAAVEWGGNFNGHDVQAIFLGKALKYTMPADNNNAASGMMGLAGRVAYNYKNRYMVEFNVGYNGTEQFAPERRFSLFPAISAGWVLTEEEFFPKNTILTFFKLRASYGEVGNDLLGSTARRFLYLPSTYYPGAAGYYIGNGTGQSANPYYPGSAEGVIGNHGITWERARKYDVGVEMQMFSGRLTVEADWFREKRSNILTTLEGITGAIAVMAALPPANVGETINRGFEVAVGWNDHIGDFRYNIEGDVSYARNKVLYRAEAIKPYWWNNATGFSIGQRFGLISDGFYNTTEDLANRPYHQFSADKVTLGDIRYKDLNGDGIIDTKNDVAPIGYPNFPQFIFNVKLNLNWKNFDTRILFTGTARGSYYLNSNYSRMFYKTAGNAWKWQYDGRWTPEKVAAGEEITYPRPVMDVVDGDNNFITSDFWMCTNDFFKLKNIELGYTLKARNMTARVFVNANNVVTFGAKRLREIGIDPESKDNILYIYPLTRIYNIGVNLTF